ncbi:ABC transporter ATP-binding protein [Mesosutterella sp. AGMB02718]|uniref:ABC transporter ATP-binding protein n=1 Tax=Mesosutterella faecium TaxID=2925194 RepID=A0ABT7IQ21_9BURK|nr:ABC transporter ATP-binding protein [Mesosutterella sp. AGMB02718]MDL2060491.1 ABC transporter ATP-binding protein [Mesosutterella sp. AGMB02718]
MSVALTLKNLCRSYVKDNEKFWAVDHVNLEVTPGEFLTFLGPSGCGKTTTLRMVAGFASPTDGSILLDGRDVTSLPANERNMGFVFQNYALFPHMRIFDNVAYGLKVRGESSSEIAKKVREGLAMVGLEKAEHRYPNQLSGGEQQRVALARVLVLRPQLLLMDEPLSNLDAKLRLHMRSEIRRIQQELGVTCLYVTHDQKEALTMSDRIMVMNHGHIEQLGTPMELYEDPATAFVADFIGQANLIEGRLDSDENGYALFEVGGRKLRARMGRQNPPKKAEEALLVVRPENLRIAQPGESGFPLEIVNRYFEGDRVDYEVVLPGSGQKKPFSMSVPFLPGTKLVEQGTIIEAAFTPEAGVVIRR